MKLIAEFERVLTPFDEKTNISLPFVVGDDFSFLRFTASYYPKRLTDKEKARVLIFENIERDGGKEANRENWQNFMPLLNLVTLSLDDSESYRGACHRQADFQTFFLSEKEASPGLIKGEIKKGQWCAVLNVHALVTEKCTYSLKIEGGDEGDR